MINGIRVMTNKIRRNKIMSNCIVSKETTDSIQDELHALEEKIKNKYRELIRESQFMFADSEPGNCYNDCPGDWTLIDSGCFSVQRLYTEQFFRDARNCSRSLYLENPFAVNAIENRVNYVIGKGHLYHVTGCRKCSKALIRQVQKIINKFVENNRWFQRQQEMIRRYDRDGEVFLRLFHEKNGETFVRFVEPEQIYTPRHIEKKSWNSYGLLTDQYDTEKIIGYWIDGEFVPGDSIQHRKNNVDMTIKRGIPLLFSVQKNLKRAEKLLRNMSVVAEIQSAIALIRKHSNISGENIRRFVRNQVCTSDGEQHFRPGTIIDTNEGIDYEFPIAAIDASRYIQILQAELRAIASRLIMPEFMISSDASNANYSSTMIAEGPSVKMFERLQSEIIRDDIMIMNKVILNAVKDNILPGDIFEKIFIQAIPPTLAVRDRLNEARANEILMKNGILSPQSMSMRYGLDPEKEVWLKKQYQHICDGPEKKKHSLQM